MKYVIPDGSNGLDLVERDKYTVTFEVDEGAFKFYLFFKVLSSNKT